MAKQSTAPFITPRWVLIVMGVWDVLVLIWVTVWPSVWWTRWALSPFAVGGLVLLALTWQKRRKTIKYWHEHIEHRQQIAALARMAEARHIEGPA